MVILIFELLYKIVSNPFIYARGDRRNNEIQILETS
jgi:hypothetical protein